VNEQTLEILREPYRCDDFPSSATDGRRPVNKKRNVAAKSRRKFGQLAIGATDLGQFTQSEQDGCGIAASSAEARADRHGLFEMDADSPRRELEFLEKKPGRFRGEIVLRVGQRRIGAGELDASGAIGDEVNVEHVAEGNGRHQCFEFVKTIGAASKNVEIEIDFGGSELFHCPKTNIEMTMTDKLILALDMDRADEALAFVRLLKPHLSLFKVGNQLFTREGPAFVRALRAEGVDLFLDQKWHDIPQTVAHAVKSAVALDVRYVTVHASGGLEMLQAAQEAVKGSRTEILAVTVLTSLDDGMLREIGFDRTAAEQVVRLARIAVLAGVSGLVCSPLEIDLIRRQIQEPIKLVTPGVRSAKDDLQDQKRTLSAAEALKRGANHLVIGRPITKATDPVAATQALMAECGLS
jgi:orotidine-5'-phosphate decarboxylase